MNSYQASRKYGIPRTTIVDRVKRRRGVIKDTRGRPTEIDVENERRLTGLRTLEKYGFALSAKLHLTLELKATKPKPQQIWILCLCLQL